MDKSTDNPSGKKNPGFFFNMNGDSDQVNNNDEPKPGSSNSTPVSPLPNILFMGVPSSPPKFVSLEQIMTAANGVKNMVLAHEIAVDKDFKLEKVEPPENSLEHRVKKVMHQAFWDLLQEQLAEDPPNYSQALVLLNDVREGLLSLLLPHQTRLKSQITEFLDLELIEQQVKNGTLDFKAYSDFIISAMAKFCAPIRDETIAELAKKTEVVPIFRGILEVLDLMKLDIANFTIEQIRPHIQQQSVEYERKKFQEFIETQSQMALGINALEFTFAWLKRSFDRLVEKNELAIDSQNQAESNQKPFGLVLSKAYMELLEWDKDNPFPETLVMDQNRYLSLRDQVALSTLLASILLLTYSTVGESIQGITGFKEQLKNNLTILLEGSANSSESELKQKLESICVQVIQEVNECLKKHGFNELSVDQVNALKGQLTELASKDHRIRQLIKFRMFEFIELLVASPTATQIKIPPGLSTLQAELARITRNFLRLITHNRAVYGDFYMDIISKLKSDQERSQVSDGKLENHVADGKCDDTKT